MSVSKAASGVVSKVTAAVRGTKVTVKELLQSEGGWKVIHDGKLAETLLFKSPSGNLLGEDEFGNKYFEDQTAQYGRNRWVLYADKDNETGENPSTVPPEWHGWLHFVSDQVPTYEPFARPRWMVPARGHPTGTMNRYGPKGSWAHGAQRRRWVKHSVWSGMPDAVKRVNGSG